MRIKARGLRYYDPEYPLANMVCTIYGNFPHIDKNKDKTDPDQHHYVEAIGGKMGLSALRLIADAQPGEDVSATHAGDSQSEADVIHRGERMGVCHGGGDWGSRGL